MLISYCDLVIFNICGFQVNLSFYYRYQVSMQLDPTTNNSDSNQKPQLEQLQNLPLCCQPLSNPDIQSKLQLQLYLHFEQTLPTQQYHYNQRSQFFKKPVSKQQITSETIKYLNYFKVNIKQLPPQHYQQLLFLIDICNDNHEIITNVYYIPSFLKGEGGLAKFFFHFWHIKKKTDLRQFLAFDNWNHLFRLSFFCCNWFYDNQWRALVEHAGNFKNLQELNLWKNKVTEIKEGDIERFKSLAMIDLRNNPLSAQSKEVLIRLRQRNKDIEIKFDQ